MVHLLNEYDNYLHFCYTEVGLAQKNRIEEALIDAYTPPINKRIKGKHGALVRAL